MTAERLEDDETTLVRSTATEIATRCRESQTADVIGHGICWAALRESGFSEMRTAADDGHPLASAAQTAAVVEELSRSVCGGQLLGHLLASELLRLAGGQPPAEVAAADAPISLVLDDVWRDLAGANGVAWDSAASTCAIGVAGDALAIFGTGNALPPADPSRCLREVGGPPGTIPGGRCYRDVRDRFFSFALTMLAADLAGCAAGALEDAVAYVKGRVQFDVPVGSFQAVQHMAAGAFVLVEAMRSALLSASWALDGPDDPLALRTALVAKSFAGDAAIQVVESAVQMFGGIAITWEFPVHRHLRRALADREIFGNEHALRALLVSMDGES